MVDVRIAELAPGFGISEGGTVITVRGTGFYDSSGKKFKFESKTGEREMAAVWDRKEKAFTCKSPPAAWLLGDDRSPNAAKLKLSLTLNGQDWICAGTFEYYDPVVERMSYDLEFGEGMGQEEKAKKLGEEEPLPEEPPILDGAKKAEEQAKIAEETELFTTAYKRTGTVFYMWGTNFKKSNVLSH